MLNSRKYSVRDYEVCFQALVLIKKQKLNPRNYDNMGSKREFLFSHKSSIRKKSPRSREVSDKQVNLRLGQLRNKARNYAIKFKLDYLEEDRDRFPMPHFQQDLSLSGTIDRYDFTNVTEEITSARVYSD